MSESPKTAAPPADATLARRVVCRSETREALRKQYGDACQVCGSILRLDPNHTYAEVHALLPPGGEEPEEAPREHCLVLCPEHHALFDAGMLALDPKDLRLACADATNPYHGKALKRSVHIVPQEVLDQAWASRRIPEATLSDEEEELPPACHKTTDSLIADVLAAGLEPNEERGFARYINVMAGGRSMAATGKRMHRQFSWAQLRRHAPSYVRNGDPTAYQISSTRPERIDAHTDKIRFMLACAGRNPAPLVAVRDDEGLWWMDFCGL